MIFPKHYFFIFFITPWLFISGAQKSGAPPAFANSRHVNLKTPVLPLTRPIPFPLFQEPPLPKHPAFYKDANHVTISEIIGWKKIESKNKTTGKAFKKIPLSRVSERLRFNARGRILSHWTPNGDVFRTDYSRGKNNSTLLTAYDRHGKIIRQKRRYYNNGRLTREDWFFQNHKEKSWQYEYKNENIIRISYSDSRAGQWIRTYTYRRGIQDFIAVYSEQHLTPLGKKLFSGRIQYNRAGYPLSDERRDEKGHLIRRFLYFYDRTGKMTGADFFSADDRPSAQYRFHYFQNTLSAQSVHYLPDNTISEIRYIRDTHGRLLESKHYEITFFLIFPGKRLTKIRLFEYQ